MAVDAGQRPHGGEQIMLVDVDRGVRSDVPSGSELLT